MKIESVIKVVAGYGGLWQAVAAVAGCRLKHMTLNRKNINSNHAAIVSRLEQIR